ncbi:MAG: carboxypeptidase-like regulatory domain-containing protein [Planctomycetota bacterium]
MNVRATWARWALVGAVVAAAALAASTWLRPPARVEAEAARGDAPPSEPTPAPAPPAADVAPSTEPVAPPAATGPRPFVAPTGALPVAPPDPAFAPPPDPHDEGVPARGMVGGTVRDREGRPVAGAIVRRVGAKGGGRNGRTTTDAAGAFRLVGLPPGKVALEAVVPDLVTRGNGLGTATFDAEAGATDVAVVVDVGLEVVLRWADASPAPASASVQVPREGGPPRVDARFGPDGVARVRGLLATDRLVVWVPQDDAGRSVLVRDVEPGGEVALTRREGHAITGVVKGLGDAAATTVWAEESDLALRVVGRLRADGHFELRGLPDGTRWRVAATVAGPSEEDPGRSVAVDDVAPGATVDLELPAPK